MSAARSRICAAGSLIVPLVYGRPLHVGGQRNRQARSGRRVRVSSAQARRAILHDQIAVSRFSNLEYRMAELEEQVRVRNGNGADSDWIVFSRGCRESGSLHITPCTGSPFYLRKNLSRRCPEGRREEAEFWRSFRELQHRFSGDCSTPWSGPFAKFRRFDWRNCRGWPTSLVLANRSPVGWDGRRRRF